METSERSVNLVLSDSARSIEVLLRDAAYLFSVLATSDVGLWSLDLTTGFWTLSERARAMLGLPTNDNLDAPAVALADFGAWLPDGAFHVLRADTGESAWLASASQPILDAQGRTVRLVGTLLNRSSLRHSQIERDSNENRLDAALTVGRMVIWDLDIATGLVSRSANAAEVLGSRCEPILNFFARIHPEDRAKVDWETSANPVPPEGDIRFRYHHPNGCEMWLETSAVKIAVQGERGHIIGITSDITARQKAEDRLCHAAHHDSLTGLLNRKAWTARVEELATAEPRVPHRLLVFDIDLFKAINDGLGHDAGDAVLVAIGERLQAAAPLLTASARLGGDEFAALAPGGEDEIEVARAIDACLRMVCMPVAIGGREVALSISAGVARFPEDGTTADDLTKNADLALYAAKAGGRRRVSLFTPDMRAALDSRLSLLAAFGDGLKAGHVGPFYQPKISLATGRLVGFEALARWNHPIRGLLTPAVFAPAFEDGDIARRLGDAMRAAVLADMRRWIDRGLSIGRVAVNCVGSELADGEFGRTILREIEAAGVPPAQFEIEVTEGVMMDRDAAPVARSMVALRAAGIALSLDDFGTGYASLIHLKRFPVDVIKIDRSFVSGLGDASDAAIVSAIIGMGRSLGITTVAEGVETVDQAAKLLALGCDQAQGFLFGKPMHPGRVPWFIKRAQLRVDSFSPMLNVRTASKL